MGVKFVSTGVTCSGHGQCIPQGLYGYMCRCDPGYTSTNCNLSVQPWPQSTFLKNQPEKEITED